VKKFRKNFQGVHRNTIHNAVNTVRESDKLIDTERLVLTEWNLHYIKHLPCKLVKHPTQDREISNTTIKNCYTQPYKTSAT
jgi:hypothetical protein